MQKAVHISVRLPVEIRNEGDRVVTSCFLLDTPRDGLNKPEALSALTEAVRCFLYSCLGSHSFDRMLRDHVLAPQDARIGIIDGNYIEVSLTLTAPASEK